MIEFDYDSQPSNSFTEHESSNFSSRSSDNESPNQKKSEVLQVIRSDQLYQQLLAQGQLQINVITKAGIEQVIIQQNWTVGELLKKVVDICNCQNEQLPKQCYIGMNNISSNSQDDQCTIVGGLESDDNNEVLDYYLTCMNKKLDLLINNTTLKVIYIHKDSILQSQTQQIKKVLLSDFTFKKCLGKGGTSQVFLVRHKVSCKLFALKMIKKSHLSDFKRFEQLLRERKILINSSNNQFIATMHACFESDQHLNFLLEFYPGGELFFHIQRQRLTEQQAKFYFAEVLVCFEFLHSNKILYRDLKPENIVIDLEGHLRLTDFGLSKLGLQDDDVTDSFCGSPEYMAPEIIKRQGYSYSVDFYTMGAFLYELTTGLPPYYSNSTDLILQSITSQELIYPQYISQPLQQLLDCLLDKNPRHRIINFDQVKNCEWLKGIAWKDIEIKKDVPPFEINIYESYIHEEFHNVPLPKIETDKNQCQSEQLFNFFDYLRQESAANFQLQILEIEDKYKCPDSPQINRNVHMNDKASNKILKEYNSLPNNNISSTNATNKNSMKQLFEKKIPDKDFSLNNIFAFAKYLKKRGAIGGDQQPLMLSQENYNSCIQQNKVLEDTKFQRNSRKQQDLTQSQDLQRISTEPALSKKRMYSTKDTIQKPTTTVDKKMQRQKSLDPRNKAEQPKKSKGKNTISHLKNSLLQIAQSTQSKKQIFDKNISDIRCKSPYNIAQVNSTSLHANNCNNNQERKVSNNVNSSCNNSNTKSFLQHFVSPTMRNSHCKQIKEVFPLDTQKLKEISKQSVKSYCSPQHNQKKDQAKSLQQDGSLPSSNRQNISKKFTTLTNANILSPKNSVVLNNNLMESIKNTSNLLVKKRASLDCKRSDNKENIKKSFYRKTANSTSKNISDKLDLKKQINQFTLAKQQLQQKPLHLNAQCVNLSNQAANQIIAQVGGCSNILKASSKKTNILQENKNKNNQ